MAHVMLVRSTVGERLNANTAVPFVRGFAHTCMRMSIGGAGSGTTAMQCENPPTELAMVDGAPLESKRHTCPWSPQPGGPEGDE